MIAITNHQGAALPVPAVALEVLSTVPAWAIVHAAKDNRNAPLIRQGEIVVVEHGGTAGWYPVDGGLFLIEYATPPMHGYQYERRSREIVQTYRNRRGDWYVGSLRRGQVGGTIYCADGPYRDEQHLSSKLLGPVIGILTQGSTLRAVA